VDLRQALGLGILLCAVACGSGGGARTEADGGVGTVGPPEDGGPDAGPSDPTVDAGPTDAGPLGGGDWRQYRHDLSGGSENPGIFAASEVANLRDWWTLELGKYVYTQAVAAEGLVVYTTGFSGKLVAVDEATGIERWPAKTLNAQISTACGGSRQPGFWASAAIVGGVIYAASPDGNVYALRASDGGKIWTSSIADPTAAGHGEFVQSSPAVSTKFGRVYLGVASSDHCDEVAGRIVALDLATGAVRSQTLVKPGQQGATIWSSISVAEDENRIYATTGNRIGPASDEPYAQAFLALDPGTLQVLDHWQNPTLLENADFGSSPALLDSAGLKLIAATSKDGNLYVLRRDALSAGPLWKFPIARIDPENPGVGGDPSAGWGSISTPAVAHGVLYAAGGRTAGPREEPGSVVAFAFEPTAARVLWTHATRGYVIAPVAAAGEILAVESSAPDGSTSWLEILDAADGKLLRTFDGTIATYAGPSIAHGLIFWTDAFGHARALGVPNYRR
jgi:outer membrane protein assembly factor BamB